MKNFQWGPILDLRRLLTGYVWHCWLLNNKLYGLFHETYRNTDFDIHVVSAVVVVGM